MNRSVSVGPPGPAEISDVYIGRQFQAIAEIAGDIAFSIDVAGGALRYVSPAVETLLGYAPDHVREQLAEAPAGGPLEQFRACIDQRLRQVADGGACGQRVVGEFDIRGLWNQLVPVEMISTVLADAQGKPAHLVGILRDLSPRRAREAEQKRFASMLNHEFRTPLSTIDGAIQRLEVTGANADEGTRQRYRKIATAVDRLIAMLDDYLSPERMAALGRERQPSSIAPAQLLEEGAAQARAAGRRVSIEAGALPAAMRCEPEGLRLAFKVLIDNAIQFSPGDSVIELGARCAGGGLELAVRDHGPGVPESEAGRIFDKFYRGANAGGLPGSGLGLYMARSVIDVHGGSVSVVRPSGGGSEFRIWLPISDTAGKHLASGEPNSDNQARQSGSALGGTQAK